MSDEQLSSGIASGETSLASLIKQKQQSSQHLSTNNTTMSGSSLSTEECSSSRYSSLQDNESYRSAILDSFRMHWVQAWSVMENKVLNDISMDDLSSIVNHLEQMISLLMEECNSDIRNANSLCDSKISEQSPSAGYESTTEPIGSLSPLMEYLFEDSILDKIFHWSEVSGEWKYAMYLEQLKLYELLISQSCPADLILSKQAFLRPLLRLLEALSGPSVASLLLVSFVEIEKRLVLLLNTLCVAISQNMYLLDVLLVFTEQDQQTSSRNGPMSRRKSNTEQMLDSSPRSRDSDMNFSCDNRHQPTDYQQRIGSISFPIFALLTQFVHREGAIGQQSRDALLLCLAMSRHHEKLAYYIVGQTDFCPLLATGLSALFSSLPRVLIGQSMSAEQFQYKDDMLRKSKEIEQFLKCLEFCNAVVQISHELIRVQLLNYIYNGFLVSVIGPALHQDVAHVSIEDLETEPQYSNTLDEIITTTAYLDLFIRAINEPNLMRIFLEFLCFEQYENRCILATLISRICAKSKLSLITIILFKTLLDLNCEDLQYVLIFKHLLQGKHLMVDGGGSGGGGGEQRTANGDVATKVTTENGIKLSMCSYQLKWLNISGQKLFSNSLSHYMQSLCQQPSSMATVLNHTSSDNDHRRPLTAICGCHSAYYLVYMDYLHDARISIDICRASIDSWKNSFSKPCAELLDCTYDQSIIFTTTMESDLNHNNNVQVEENLVLSEKNSLRPDISTLDSQQVLSNVDNGNEKTIKKFFYDEKRKKIDYIENRSSNINEEAYVSVNETPIGLFLTQLFERLSLFFENDVLTNLHLTGLFTRLCHFPHRLLLAFFFDETLARAHGVPCLLHLLQKLSLDAQGFCDKMPNFESMFLSARINLQSVPLGELNCQLLTSSFHQPKQRTNSIASFSNQANRLAVSLEASSNKAIGALKNFFFRSNSNNRQSISRRGSNASINSHMLEVISTGVRYSKPRSESTSVVPADQRNASFEAECQNQLIYNLIIFDEFLLELSAILIEHSVGELIE